MSTWNPSDETNMTLTGGNLIATPSSAAVAGVRGTAGHATTGKYQLQFTSVTMPGAFDMIGIGDAAQGLTDETSAGHEFMLSSHGGGTIYANNTFNTSPAYAAACTIDMCFDFGAMLGWARVNGSAWNAGGTADPATGVGGYTITFSGANPFFPFVELTGTTAHATLNTKPSGLISGFSAWDPPFAYSQARVIA